MDKNITELYSRRL